MFSIDLTLYSLAQLYVKTFFRTFWPVTSTNPLLISRLRKCDVTVADIRIYLYIYSQSDWSVGGPV